MKHELIGLLFVVGLTCASAIDVNSQNVSRNSNDLRTELEATNNTMEQLYITEDADALTNLYATQLTFFPEYKPAIFEVKVLNKFFKDWFAAGDIRSYKKKIFSVEQYTDHLLEIGTFNLNCSSGKNPQGEYSGHYMVLWKRDKAGKLSIVSETFGAEIYIEPEVVPYADVSVERINFNGTDKVSKKLMSEVEAFDAIVLKAVATGDGNARANGFTNDAILSSAFDSIHVGMETIRPKMLKTYTPSVSFIVKHYYNRIVDLGDYVFVTAQYKGGWGDTTKGGRFEGNISSLFKRTNGKLLAYRQAGNRDSNLILYDN
ncbi:hypothetical protein WBG78_20765 [Chryseolinea sp. T2]|uniref:YybH family protein n=1 Tax=Chryseolinea sp. T2 TaxID=3129255 RepID=UPI003076AD50